MKKIKKLSIIAILVLLFSVVMAACGDSLQSISVAPPTKTEYKVGETLDVNGAKITLKYKKGDDKEIDFDEDGVEYSPKVLNTAGEKVEITVTYKGKSDKFEVKVVLDAVGISVDSQPTKTSYKDDEEVSLAGGKIKITYHDQSSEVVDITNDRLLVTQSGWTNNKKTVTVLLKSDNTIKTSFELSRTLSNAKSFSVKTWPVSYVYYTTSEKVNFEDGELEIEYQDTSKGTKTIDFNSDMLTWSYFDEDNQPISKSSLFDSVGAKVIRVSYDEEYVDIPIYVMDVDTLASYAYTVYTSVERLAKGQETDGSTFLYAYYKLVDSINFYYPEDNYRPFLDNYPDCEYDFTASIAGVVTYAQIGSTGLSINQMYEYGLNFIYNDYQGGNYFVSAVRWGLFPQHTSEGFADMVESYVEQLGIYIDTNDFLNVDGEKLFSDFLNLAVEDKYAFLTIFAGKNFEQGGTSSFDKNSVFTSFIRDIYIGVNLYSTHGEAFSRGVMSALYAVELQAICYEYQTKIEKARGTSSVSSILSSLQTFSELMIYNLGNVDAVYDAMISADKADFDSLLKSYLQPVREDAFIYNVYLMTVGLEYQYAFGGYDPIFYIASYRDFEYVINSLSSSPYFARLNTEPYLGAYINHDEMSSFIDWFIELESNYNSLLAAFENPSLNSDVKAIAEKIIGLLRNQETEEEKDYQEVYDDFLALSASAKIDLFMLLDLEYNQHSDFEFFAHSASLRPLLYASFMEFASDEDVYKDITAFLIEALKAIEHDAAFTAWSNPKNHFKALSYAESALSLYQDIKDEDGVAAKLASMISLLETIKTNHTVSIPQDTITGITLVSVDTAVYALNSDLDLDSIYIEVSYQSSPSIVLRLSESIFGISGFNSSTEGIKTVTIDVAGASYTIDFKVFVMDLDALTTALDALYNYQKADTTEYFLKFGPLNAIIDYYLDEYDYQDPQMKKAVSDFIKGADSRTQSIYDKYLVVKDVLEELDSLLVSEDLREFFEYYLGVAQDYIDSGDISSAVTLWEKFFDLNIEDQYSFMCLLDISGFEQKMFTPVEDKIYHSYSVLFDDSDNNIFSNIIFEHYYYKLYDDYGSDIANGANRLMLMTEFIIVYRYWVEYRANDENAAMHTTNIYLFFSLYLSDFEFPPQEPGQINYYEIAESEQFKEMFGDFYKYVRDEYYFLYFGVEGEAETE